MVWIGWSTLKIFVIPGCNSMTFGGLAGSKGSAALADAKK